MAAGILELKKQRGMSPKWCNVRNLISRDLLKQRDIKTQEIFIAARRFEVIMTSISRD